MKILIMVHNLTGGGAERVAALWAEGFVLRGYEVGIVLNCNHKTPMTYKIPSSVKRYNIAGNHYVNWIANKLYRILGLDIYYIRNLRRVIKDFKPEVAICVLQPWAEWSRKASVGMNIKIVNTEHNVFKKPNDAKYNPMTTKLYEEKYVWNKRYSHVTVLTEVDKRCAEKTLDNVSVLPNPLAFVPCTIIPSKKKVILAVGRLNAWHVKGFDLLIKSWGRICLKYPEWKLQIAGNDRKGAQQYLQTIADNHGVGSQLEFLGYRENMLSVYQDASIFVLSSRYEGFGMVLIEAMSQGCAPIACDYEGRQREIITSDDEGIICPVEDVNALAEAMKKMIENEIYRKNTQINAIKRSRYYSIDNIMDKWEEVIEESCIYNKNSITK